MNYLGSNATIKGEGYSAPLLDYYEVEVEAGFETSMQDITIAPWESDNDSLEL